MEFIKVLNKENYFQKHAGYFIRLPCLPEKGEKVSKEFTSHNSIGTR